MAVSWRSVWGVVVALAFLCYVMALMGSASCRWGSPLLPQLAAFDGPAAEVPWAGDVRNLDTAWNRLCFGSKPPVSLHIALFVKKWPTGGTPGGLERHAMTLHRVLADRGHSVHVFTTRQPGATTSVAEDEAEENLQHANLHLHFVEPNAGGGLH